MIRVSNCDYSRLVQGDILSNIEYIEDAYEENGELILSCIKYPYVLVISQDCDLMWDGALRKKPKFEEIDGLNYLSGNNRLVSSIVLPLYNAEHFFTGKHLDTLNIKMQSFNRSKNDGKNILSNTNPRYHYLKFDDDIEVPDSVIDFKHYFSINIDSIIKNLDDYKVSQVSELFRENISQRFTSYLSRIGLPEIK